MPERRQRARRDRWVNLALLVGSTALLVAVVEGGARLAITPSPRSYGTLFGRDLPPFRVVPSRTTAAAPTPAASAGEPDAGTDAPVWADLQGPIREDPLLGYAAAERVRSPRGWWITNNLGARSTTDTSPQTVAGTRRVLVFGESFATGSRVRQEAAWTSVLATLRPDLELVNLAVDGYSMGQSLLRFRETTHVIDYDVALLVFVPSMDLWRDVNTVRSLARRSWNSYTVMPRFVLKHDALALIRSPYRNVADVYADNASGLGETLRRHLRAYDRFYFESVYESPPLIGDLVLWKLGALLYFNYEKGRLLRTMGAGHIALDCEAMRIAHAIFTLMNDEAHTRGKQFMLVVMPDSHQLRKMRRSAASARNWQDVVRTVCEPGMGCIDVTPALSSAAPTAVDRGFDGTHYGPSANRIIAAAMADALR